jgi:methylenetetrahydrofolate dehydrogenase (NADP+) / methenyltetrahydrofolate cyclohydrolase
MIIDGHSIAERVYVRVRESVQTLGRAPVLTIVVCAPNFETRAYLALKEKKARTLGIRTRIIELPAESETTTFLKTIQDVLPSTDGVIVQLPLPPLVDADAVLAAIPSAYDADALNPKTALPLSPVAGAMKEILESVQVEPKDKLVTVIGSGRLVGLPAYRWFERVGAHVSVVTKDTTDIGYYTRAADIVVCGAGVAGLLQPSMVRDGVVILDAGTSEEGGVLRGDADPLCAEKASVFTPVPGGIGPITIAILLLNVVDCAHRHHRVV